MQSAKPALVSINDIAMAARVSKTTVSYVMRNRAGPSRAMREHVLQVAKQLGYVPDPRMATYMTQVRRSKTKDLEPLIWLTGHKDPSAWENCKFLSPYFEGASERALQLGYRIELVTDKENDGVVPMRRIARMINNRGISGVIVTHQFRAHVKLIWDSLAAVTLEGRTLAPRLDQVKSHYFYNLMLAMKMLRRFGYTRIGVCLNEHVDRESSHAIRGGILYFQASLPKAQRVPPLFYIQPVTDEEDDTDQDVVKDQVLAWARKVKPDAVICLHNGMERWLKGAGHRVPGKMGVVHLATDDDVSDWAGIHSRRREIGAVAVEQVVSLIQNRNFGVPNTPITMEMKGIWHGGRTLLVPKPK